MLAAHYHLIMLNQYRHTPILPSPLSPPPLDRVQEAGGSNTYDMDLVRRTRLGERGTFDLLVLKYQRRIIKLALRYTHNPCDAEDIAQETFIRAHRGLQGFRGDCAFYTWLHRIAINSTKSVRSMRAREPQLMPLEVSEGDEAPDTPLRLRDTSTPEHLALTEEIRVIVNAAVQALPAEFRSAVIFRELDGMAYADIAEMMNTPVGTVRSRIYRAREVIDLHLRRVFDNGLGRNAKG
jgi:RNA polymerase sigma-70 factor (ECF subfamily)